MSGNPPAPPNPLEAPPPGPRSSGGFGNAPEAEGSINWRRYVAALRRYKWLMLLVSLVGGGAGVVAARFAKPEYVAQATIWIESGDRSRGEDRGPIRSGRLLGGRGWVELLESFVVLDHAVLRVRLYLDIASEKHTAVFQSFALDSVYVPGDYRLTVDESGQVLTLATRAGAVIEKGIPGDSLGRSLGFNWIPLPTALEARDKIDFPLTTPRDAARKLRLELRTQVDLSGAFIRVELAGTDPSLVASTVNAVVERHVEVAAELKRAKLTELAEILGDQLEQSRKTLVAAEMALESFRVNTVTLPGERTPVAAGLELTRDPVFENFFDMRVTRDQLAQDREAVQRVLGLVRDSGLSIDALEAIGAVQQSSEVKQALAELAEGQAGLRAIRRRYTARHPTVLRAEEDIRQLERTTVPALIQDLLDELAVRQTDLDARIAAASRELQQIPPRAIQEARLTRDVAVAENLQTMLQQRYEEARLAEASSIPDVRVLSPAVVPQSPTTNRRRLRLAVMGLLAGIGFAVGGAVLLDRVDRRVRYPEQITHELGLPLLGVVPRLKRVVDDNADIEALPVIEALRGIRLNLSHAHGEQGPLVFTVTSPGAGDGKSFISLNLALAFAEAGHRTVLIDGDNRRGSLHKALNAQRKPGLMDFLRGDLSQAATIQTTAFRDLFFAACGTRASDAPEMLGSGKMAQFISDLQTGADMGVIVIDSPPLIAGVDAFALGTLTKNLLMVLRFGVSDRGLAEAKLAVLDRLPVRVLGAVLNDVGKGAGYGYYRHDSYYLAGYEHQDEDGVGHRQLLRGPD